MWLTTIDSPIARKAQPAEMISSVPSAGSNSRWKESMMTLGATMRVSTRESWPAPSLFKYLRRKQT